jgi:hypothetical protein
MDEKRSMEMNTTHGSFDLGLELLATLPKHPHVAIQRDVATDLGLRLAIEAGQLAHAAAKQHGIQIASLNDDGGGLRTLSIMSKSWAAAQKICNAYWQVVNTPEKTDNDTGSQRTAGGDVVGMATVAIDRTANQTRRSKGGGAHAARGGPQRR